MKHRASTGGKVLKFALLSVIVTIILCLIFAFAVYFLGIDEGLAQTVVFGIMIFSVFIGAFFLAKCLSRSGLLNGFLMAVFYFVMIVLISVALNGKISFGFSGFMRFIVLSATGMLGGILGVNL